MVRTRKTWQEKLAEAKAKMPEPRTFFCDRSRQQFVIPAVAEIEELMRRVRRGRVMTVKQMMDLLRERHGVDACCPITTGIVAWIIAHAADEAEQAGRPRVVPWWRLLKSDGTLNPKYPGAGARQRAKLEAEGHRVVAKGSKLAVDGLARSPAETTLETKSNRPTTAALERKVLRRDDFGLCVLLPKEAWSKLPESGQARVEVNGAMQRVVVQIERCNCRGNGWHQHRFLSLPRSAGVTEHDRVTIRVPQ